MYERAQLLVNLPTWKGIGAMTPQPFKSNKLQPAYERNGPRKFNKPVRGRAYTTARKSQTTLHIVDAGLMPLDDAPQPSVADDSDSDAPLM